jgi:hypothetical protein
MQEVEVAMPVGMVRNLVFWADLCNIPAVKLLRQLGSVYI